MVPQLGTAVRKGGALNCISWNLKDSGALPVSLEHILPDVTSLFAYLGDSILSDKPLDPLKRFLNDRRILPKRDEIIAMMNYISERENELKHVSLKLKFGSELSE